jgi:hypothetical protein
VAEGRVGRHPLLIGAALPFDTGGQVIRQSDTVKRAGQIGGPQSAVAEATIKRGPATERQIPEIGR